ncbi:hypothetical protein PHYC_02131 [Phycisphaerales bacterium]|nr:hypothetical protein PHYC_02131 [Phycisphaerales bacterium]
MSRWHSAQRGRVSGSCASQLASALLLASLAGCTLSPKGVERERASLADAGKPYEGEFEHRVLPEIPESPAWNDILRRALAADGDAEAAYFRWAAAMERVTAAGAYPNSDISVGAEYMFSGGDMKTFDKTTFRAGFDPSMNLSLPVKVRQEAEMALSEAKMAAAQFRVAKFDIQRDALFGWADYKRMAREIELRRSEISLRRVMLEASRVKVGSMGDPQMLIAADLGLQRAESALRDDETQFTNMRAMLNSLLARDPRDPLNVPAAPEPFPEVPEDDWQMIQAAVNTFPEVAEFAAEVKGREDALELARLRWVPDISLSVGFTGTISQFVEGMVTLPTTVAKIRAGIREAQAQLRASQATLRQKRADRLSEYFTLVIGLRNAQRREKLFTTVILPGTARVAEATARNYEVGKGGFDQVIEARMLAIEAEMTLAATRAEIEKALVDISCCLGVDLDALDPAKGPVSPPPHAPQPENPEPHAHSETMP